MLVLQFWLYGRKQHTGPEKLSEGLKFFGIGNAEAHIYAG